MTASVYSITSDDRLARRSELKAELAEFEAKEQRIEKLKAVVQELDTAADVAASSHSEAAGKIQEKIEACKGDTAKVYQQRAELKEELGKVNSELETRCQSIRRTRAEILSEIATLRSKLSGAVQIRRRLADLCSPETRRKQLLNGHLLQLSTVSLRSAEEKVKALKERAESQRTDASDARTASVRLADWQWITAELQKEQSRLLAQDRELVALAVTE